MCQLQVVSTHDTSDTKPASVNAALFKPSAGEGRMPWVHPNFALQPTQSIEADGIQQPKNHEFN